MGGFISYRATVFLLLLIACSITSCQANSMLPQAHELNLPLPEYLNFVAPEPKSSYPIDSYKMGEHYPSIAHPAPLMGQNRVCIQLTGESLLEPGDFFTEYPKVGEFLPDRVKGYVDGKLAEKDEEIRIILGESRLLDEGKVIASAPGPQIICWPIELKVGAHYATIEINKTSGEVVSYSWTFELTEN